MIDEANLDELWAHPPSAKREKPAKTLEELPAPAPRPDEAQLFASPTQPADERLLLSPKAAAAMLSMGLRTLWTLTHGEQTPPSERIPHVKVGRNVRYFVDDLRVWILRKQRATRR